MDTVLCMCWLVGMMLASRGTQSGFEESGCVVAWRVQIKKDNVVEAQNMTRQNGLRMQVANTVMYCAMR